MKFLNIVLAFALCVSVTAGASAGDILGIDGEESTSVGIYIKDLKTGKVLVDHNSDLALTPASVMKAVTTASTLSLAGADKRFRTPVVLRGNASGASWDGDLVVHTVADPTIESENFKSRYGFCDSVVAAVKRAGISKINGRIVIDQPLENAGEIGKWEIEDVAWPYGAGLYGLNWRDNTFTLHPATGETKPFVPGLKIEMHRSTSGNDLIRGVGSDVLTIYSRNPNDKKWAVRSSMPDPAAVFRHELEAKLKAAGITVAGKEIKTDCEVAERKLYTHVSPAYGEIMRSLMVRSDNLFAEGMLRAIAPGASRKDCIKREKELWATRGINTKYTIINDGSGLTRANRLSARFIADVLAWMASSPQAKTYTTFFPRAGKEGTLRGFLAKSELKGLVALKTGSVSSVQAYAGYKFDDDGEPTHVIVIMVNGFFCPRSQVREGAEQLLIDLFCKD